MRIRHYPILFAAIAGVVASGMLTARDDRSAATAVAYAATRTLDTGSARFELTYQLPQSIATANLSPFAIRGLIDYRNHRGELAFGTSGQEMIFDQGVVYQRVGEQFSTDKAWVRFPTGEDLGASDMFDLQARAMFDPSHLLAFLRRASSGVRDLGSDTVRGFPTTHYEGVLDLQKIVDQAPADQRQELQDELDFIAEDMPKTISYGLWVDSGRQVRRLRIDEAEGAAITLEFYDFGVPVVLRLPSDDEVMTPEEYWEAVQKYMQEHPSDCGDETEEPDQPSEPAEEGDDPTVLAGRICVTLEPAGDRGG